MCMYMYMCMIYICMYIYIYIYILYLIEPINTRRNRMKVVKGDGAIKANWFLNYLRRANNNKKNFNNPRKCLTIFTYTRIRKEKNKLNGRYFQRSNIIDITQY